MNKDNEGEEYQEKTCIKSLPELSSARHSGATDVGITLRVTSIALSDIDKLGAHEATRRRDGPLGRCVRRFLGGQDQETYK